MPANPEQQTLQLQIPPRFEYGDWIRHAGVEEACNRLALWLVHGGRIWLTSENISGKSHLLQVLAREHRSLGLVEAPETSHQSANALVSDWLASLKDKAFWAVDVRAGDVSMNIGLAMFHLLERARDMHRPVLLAWRPDSRESGPPELMSRLKGSMEYLDSCEPPSDESLKLVMQSVARSRQWDIQPAALDTMLQWLPRRLDILVPALLFLETASLADRKKRLSQSWIREQLDAWNSDAGRQMPLSESEA